MSQINLISFDLNRWTNRTNVQFLSALLPLVTGDSMRRLTSAAPWPWPTRVTSFGSPSNAAMFSLTQCSAATWSSSA